MTDEQRRAAIEREYRRIGIRVGERLPMPRGLGTEADYLAFLLQVPDGSGIQGFTATMARRAKT
jgi:hypothetical protein